MMTEVKNTALFTLFALLIVNEICTVTRLGCDAQSVLGSFKAQASEGGREGSPAYPGNRGHLSGGPGGPIGPRGGQSRGRQPGSRRGQGYQFGQVGRNGQFGPAIPGQLGRGGQSGQGNGGGHGNAGRSRYRQIGRSLFGGGGRGQRRGGGSDVMNNPFVRQLQQLISQWSNSEPDFKNWFQRSGGLGQVTETDCTSDPNRDCSFRLSNQAVLPELCQRLRSRPDLLQRFCFFRG